MEDKTLVLGILALMIVSLVGMIYYGVGKNEKIVWLVLFSISLGSALLFFGKGSAKEE